MMWRGHIARMGKTNACRGFMENLVGKRPLGRPRYRYQDNIKLDPIKIGCGGVDWINPDQDRNQWKAVVNTEMNHQVILNLGKFLSS
jgi:hypothetical protein